MLKKLQQKMTDKVQAWLDRPLQERRAERQKLTIEPTRERRWIEEPLTVTGLRPDPVKTLPRTPLQPAIARIQGKPVYMSVETLEMLKAMDRQFTAGLQKPVDWLTVRTQRRHARNQEVAVKQGTAMFDRNADTAALVEGSPEEAAFIEAQAAAIFARAKHASDPTSADTTTFAAIRS